MVMTATTDMMRLIQSRYMFQTTRPGRYGDAKREDVFKMAEDLFGDWQRSDDRLRSFRWSSIHRLPKE